MPSFWSRKPSLDYDFRRLIDTNWVEKPKMGAGAVHIVCDIDKTYLETRFESVVQMARIAFEEASQKITVQGASEVLLAARWDATDTEGHLVAPRPLHFVSSSPPQLRSVLEEKLALDGLDWTSDTFKNQAYNLRKGRMDQLRQHVAYKSAAILRLIRAAGPGAHFVFLGDNAESDPLIYIGIKLAVEGRLDSEGYSRYLEIAGVKTEIARDVVALAEGLDDVRIREILIRSVSGYHAFDVPPFTDVVRRFANFFEAGLLLATVPVIGAQTLWPLTRVFHNLYGMSRSELAVHLRLLAGEADRSWSSAAREALERLKALGPMEARERPSPLLPRDLGAFLGMSQDDILRHVKDWVTRQALRPSPT